MHKEVADIRKTYALGSFDEKDAHEDPFHQFELWWNAAIHSEIDEVNAMTLATVDAENKPHARIVLLKGFDNKGFCFYTNYQSNKGEQLLQNPYAAIVIFWKELERQIRIEGQVEKLSDSKSNEYFLSRPLSSRIGAIASPQSKVVPNRLWLEQRETELKSTLTEETAIRPKHWGGYLLKPQNFEFWQGRPNRLHDRVLYSIEKNNTWLKQRLAP